ncbi:hypothetical protein FRACYDRAFT_249567 [Fragilariopsis cylindrus CCMP1102]|uniref:Uncharacterized protein n=1 Tax=Fragilariopsis cylindrus CCMP1102 TaxID=635003 RepID=A0A1E7ES41_9STRA|nr:hypothetical protein FRACYDRAFT_249567 [Fragilariopsis cylindrus CCMP1102]|eukprot:OEU08666.1 hypothetical protein FRACYDRAFT_249567 [Fragilariopsis cylindrus CCMP1102]
MSAVYSSCEKHTTTAGGGRRRNGRERRREGGGVGDYNDDCCVNDNNNNNHNGDNEASAGKEMETTKIIEESKESLQKFDFPLGGFGCGNIILHGDGTLQGWDIQNQFTSKEYIPNHKLPSNYWCIAAIYDDDDTDDKKDDNDDEVRRDKDDNPTTTSHSVPRPSYLLRSSLSPRSSRSAEQKKEDPQTQQQRPRPPGIPSLQIEAKYPIATITYDIPQQQQQSSSQSSPSPPPQSSPTLPFPNLSIRMEALSPLIPTSTKVSSLPLAIFTFSIKNNHSTKSISFDLLQSTINFIGWDGYTDCSSSSSSFWNENINKPFVYQSTTNTSNTATRRSTTKVRNNGDDDNDTTNDNDNNGGGGSSFSFSVNKDKDKRVNDNRTCTGLFMYTQRDLKEHITSKGSIALSAITTNTKTNTRTPTTSTDDDYDHNQDHDETNSTTATNNIQLITGVTSENELFDKFALRDFDNPNTYPRTKPSKKGETYIGEITCTFVLSWHFPYRPSTSPRDNLPSTSIWGNQYNKWFTDAKDVACQFCDDQCTSTNDDYSPKIKKATLGTISLLELTRLYVKTLYGSTIPYEILESAASKLATMRSPTMFWIEPPPSTADDPNATGIVLGNEGNECCPLNCTHVYGYTTLLERLYPDLAKNMRRSDFILNFDLSSSSSESKSDDNDYYGNRDGNAGEGCTMRFGRQNGVGFGFALDGSLACVIKTYLVVLQSDPTLDFLKSVWPNVKKQMELLWTKPYLDPKDGVIYIAQQNTYDTAMEGANTYIGSYLIVALKATSIMASLMGDINFAKKCSKQVEISTTKYEELCWNSTYKYYIADVNETNCKNSYSIGCFIDQLCAIGLSTACGFGAIFDPTHEAQARQSILRNNKITESSSGSSLHRHYHTDHFYPGDSGIRVCTYPNGRLGKGMPYQNLVSSGFEYPLAAGMILDDNIEDAITYVNTIYDDDDRGFSAGTIQFQVLFGTTTLQSIHLKTSAHVVVATLFDNDHHHTKLNASIDPNGVVTFDSKITMNAGSILKLTLSSPCEELKTKLIKEELAFEPTQEY